MPRDIFEMDGSPQEPARSLLSCYRWETEARKGKLCAQDSECWGKRMQEVDRIIAEQRVALQEMRLGDPDTWESTRPVLEDREWETVDAEDVMPSFKVTKTSP